MDSNSLHEASISESLWPFQRLEMTADIVERAGGSLRIQDTPYRGGSLRGFTCSTRQTDLRFSIDDGWRVPTKKDDVLYQFHKEIVKHSLAESILR